MSTTPVPELWDRVAMLRPRLRAHTQWHRHCYRGQTWHLLQDRAAGRHYHLTDAGHAFVRLLDGQTSIKQALAALDHQSGQPAPSREEVMELLSRLQAADLLVQDEPADGKRLFDSWQKRRRASRLGNMLRPLALRFPLLDPSPLLTVLLPLVRPLFGWGPFGAWLLVVGLAVLLGVQFAGPLATHAEARFLDPFNLVLLWIAYPVVKGLHELGHAFAVRVWGGAVHELGVMLLVLVPVPYVDASAATVFPEKSRRIVVGAAGIMVEALLAALALFVWLIVQPGWVRDLAFNVMVIGGVSTLLFNGNPLLRFDGYYVLADVLEIPNLATRSQQYYSYLAKRYLFGLREAPSPVVAAGEGPWFLVYGLASFAYLLFISLVIAVYLAGKFFVIGALLALWVLVSRLLLPLVRMLRFLASGPALRGHRRRAVAVTSGLAGAVTVFLLLVPMPFNTVAEGVLLLPETTIVRAGGSGEVNALLHADGDLVVKGEPLIRLHDPELAARERVLAARVEELRARMERELLRDRVEAAIQREQLTEVESELAGVRQRLGALTVTSPGNGELELALPADLPGRFVQKGEVFGIVRSEGAAIVRVMVPQASAEHVRRDTRALSARYPGRPEVVLPAVLLAEVPSGTHLLPSPALGSLAGGRVAVDTRDEQGITALEPVFQFDIRLTDDGFIYIPGVRVPVRFEHSPETLGRRGWRGLRQLLLDRLGS